VAAMFVCHCRALTDRDIGEAIAAGARDLDEIGRRCGAGITCGGCCPLLEELLDRAAAGPVAAERSMAERGLAATAGGR
jgi:bacterioferritin-associated ferredoxin